MTDRLEFANILRGMAALIVVIFAHFGGVFFTAPAAVTSLIWAPQLDGVTIPTLFSYIHRLGLNYGHLGVALFFLISGFVIPFSLIHFTRLQFLVARFFRIWPTYVVGFSFTLLAVYISTKYFHVPWPYNLEHIIFQYTLSRDLVWLPSIDGVSWTLEIEVKFYLVSAVIFAVFYKKMNLYALLSWGLVGLISIFYIAGIINQVSARFFQLSYILEMDFVFISYMMIGVLFNFHHRQGINILRLILSVVILFLLFGIEWKYSLLKDGFADGIKNYGIALIVFSIFYFLRFKIKTNRILDFFADISYPLYIIHPVVGYVSMRIIIEKFPNFNLLIVAVVFIMSVSLAYVIHISIEIYSNKLGKKLAKKLNSIK